MIRRLMFASLLAFSLATPSFAQDAPKPDDSIAYDLSAEDWVTTKTAHVTLDVEASVSAATAGTMRGDMVKAVDEAAKGDWRLTSFNRTQDQTGLERWSANFDARLPEVELNGLADAAKKASKAGMQITVGDIDFSPTLDEIEAARAALRTRIYKEAGDQLTALNASLPGRAYRIAQINFDADNSSSPMPRPMLRRGVMMSAMAVAAPTPEAAPAMERSEKITQTAHIVYAALPPSVAANH